MSIKRRNSWDDHASAKAYLRAKPLFALWDDTMLDLYIEHGMVDNEAGGLELACSPPREAALFMGGMPYDPWPLFPKIHCPVLIVEGGQSQNRRFMNLKDAVGLFRQGTYQLIEAAGHLIPMEKPSETCQIITDFANNILN
jgi:pimeloyl-ACP methyl ester carboxylesterase